MTNQLAVPEAEVSNIGPLFEVGEDIDSVDVTQLFDWPEIFMEYGIPEKDRVAVYVFLSVPNKDFDQNKLNGPDALAHMAAEEAEGFYAYVPIAKSSFCIWENPERARAAIRSDEHIEAAKMAKEAYEKHRLVGKYAAMTSAGTVEFSDFDEVSDNSCK